ncbi:MAG: superoxide dismutase family protein [Cetobacterium sp.]|uniref:superoxide dismutase family protein n=1 Tax=Cetobacterium sp. TaxID=2071632 RepID=UPI003F3622AF
MKKILLLSGIICTFLQSYGIEVPIKDLKSGKDLGIVKIEETKYGLVFKPELKNLIPGLHGFHIHEKGDLSTTKKDGKDVLGGGAGGHYDPEKTGKHGYPWTEDNHKGDLPGLYVDSNGEATNPVLAPRLTLEEIKGRSIMIHEHGDNHMDSPQPLGGGGPRMAAGIIPKN